MYTVYVLYSRPFDKCYVGYTSDLSARLLSHNELGTSNWTKRYRPWEVIYTEEYSTKGAAIQREKELKSGVFSEKNRFVFALVPYLPDKLVFLGAFQFSIPMVKIFLSILFSILLVLTPIGNGKAIHLPEEPNFCLFKNPLCFYNMDVLRYLQVLHQKQLYDQMAAFFYGPMKQKLGEKKLAAKLADQDFGYALKRVGIKEETAKNWSLTYQRTILGTQENFKIEAALVNDTCRVYLDEEKWNILFKRK